MEVNQVYELVNKAASEVLGKEPLSNDDLTKVIDFGEELFNAEKVDNYVRKLVDHIGRVIFVNRPYQGSAPSIMMDGWEFGSVAQKIRCDLPEADENEVWKLIDGQTYNQDVFTAPKVYDKFFDSKQTFRIPMSVAERQVKESFDNAGQLNAFVSMIFTSIENSMTIRIDALIMKLIASMVARTLYEDFKTGAYGTGSTARCVNLLYLYNQRFGKTLSAADCITDKEFIRFASYTIGLYSGRISKLSSLFNIGGTARFTPKDLQHLVLHEEFSNAAAAYLQSDTFHDQFVALPKAETVPYWQGSGTDYGFSSTSKIDVTVPTDAGDQKITATGIIGVLFDHDALCVANTDRRVKSHTNDMAEFINYWYLFDAQYIADINENFVVFYVADPA